MSKPETVFKAGGVRGAIFRNVIEKGGKQVPLPKVILEVRYRDREGNWKGTNSLSLNDLPKAILTLHKAYEYLMAHKDGPGPDSGEDSSPQPASSDYAAFSRGKLA